MDGDLLQEHKFMIRPFIGDYIVARGVKLDVNVYQGDVTKMDKCIEGFEAVSMVEM